MNPPRNFCNDFASFDGHRWLNAASEGPLPKVSLKSLYEASVWKSKPYLLDAPKFAKPIVELKQSIASLINVESRDVILGNSASYGVHLLANGINWQKGDEILLMQNDFPTDILPWLGLVKKKVKVIQLKSQDQVLTAQELSSAITKRTKLFCMTHVHTFSGHSLDVVACAKICKQKGVFFILNISQSAGSMPVDVGKMAVDAVVCAGYKWLLGPYGTGFAWIHPNLREKLDINLSYWISRLNDSELQSQDALEYKDIRGVRKYDVFATANFFNFIPFNSSIQYLIAQGLGNVYKHNQMLVNALIKKLDQNKYSFISPLEEKGRSCLVVISHLDPSRNKIIYQKLVERNIYTAFWKGNIRISPHIYNTMGDIQKLSDFLNRVK